MSEFTDILTARANIKYQTPFLIDAVLAAATLTFDRQPAEECRLEVLVSGATISSGLVNIAGSTNESFSIDANGSYVGTKDFSSVSGLTLSGIEDGYVSVKAVTRIGHPVNQEVARHSYVSCRFYPVSGRIRMSAPGQQKIAKYKMMVAPDKNLSETDTVYPISGFAGLTMGIISFVEPIIDFDGTTHHVEAEIQEI